MSGDNSSAGNGDSVPLVGVAAEFRDALKLEIEAARKASSSAATHLIDGRRIGTSAEGFDYLLRLESTLNPPDDSPGDLHVPGRAPIDAIVVFVEGANVRLNIKEDLGEHVPHARFQSNMVHLLKKLVVRIEELHPEPNPAGDRILRTVPARGEPSSPKLPPTLNESQAAAIRGALGRDTTFIWGPPGTGKTRAIGELCAQLYRDGKSALVVSHTNVAVDQALVSTVGALSPELDKAAGEVFRMGEPRDQRLRADDELRIETHIDRRSEGLRDRINELVAERAAMRSQIEQLERAIGICEWAVTSDQEQDRLTADRQMLRELENSLLTLKQSEAGYVGHEESWLQLRAESAELVARLDRLPVLEQQADRRQHACRVIREQLVALAAGSDEAERLLERVLAASAVTRRLRRLPNEHDQRTVIDGVLVNIDRQRAELAGAEDELGEAVRARDELMRDAQQFEDLRGETPSQLIQRADSFIQGLESVREQIGATSRSFEARSAALRGDLEARLASCRAWGFITSSDTQFDDMLAQHSACSIRARDFAAGENMSSLATRIRDCRNRIADIAREHAEIEERMQRIEFDVVADAKIIATTLTRAYLRDSIRARKYDTVILDEASMAPIPALWVTASLASRAVVVVGDFKQLPPISHSDDPIAEKWLASDIFEVSGIRHEYESGGEPVEFSALNTQYRMHSQISSIANDLIYGGTLTNGPSVDVDHQLDEWFNREWGGDAPVVFVDTSPLNAWVTYAGKGARSSRLNFLSAVLCTAIAERMMLDTRPDYAPGEPPRILVGSPYRPHADLLNVLLRESCISDEVSAGTAHTFQGCEADVVLFDLVNDEPHWRVGLFWDELDESNRKLLAVALTRARKRLVLVGNYEYNKRKAKKAFLGQLLEMFDGTFPIIPADDLLSKELLTKASEAGQALSASQMVDEGFEHVVMTEQDVFPSLMRDLEGATEEVVIYSPFLTENRVAELQVSIRRAVANGSQVVVVTKPLSEREKSHQATAKNVEQGLRDWGVAVIHKSGMHEKIVLVDDRIIWSGSLNPLSFSNTREVMERRVSERIVDRYKRTLRTHEMIDEHARGECVCPVCDGELVPSDGKDAAFYWKCIDNGCFTRSIGQPLPKDGLLTCSTCGGDVYFGEWGGRFVWRCTSNARHRMPFSKHHLRLPKMRNQIPPSTAREIEAV